MHVLRGHRLRPLHRRRLAAALAVAVVALVVAHCSLELDNHLGKQADQCIALVALAGAAVGAASAVAGRASPWPAPCAEESGGLAGRLTPAVGPLGRPRAGPEQLQVFRE